MSSPVITIEKGCLICGGDLKGNKAAKFYCKKCNILFSYENLLKAGKTEAMQPTMVKAVRAKQEPRFVGSILSNRFHSVECWLAKNIKEENKLFFSTAFIARTKGFRPCKKCIQPT
jgi:transposase-like protein